MERNEEKNQPAGKEESLPGIDFSTFIHSLATAARFHLGDSADPESGEKGSNLALAKQTIDIMMMLKLKTKGNLTEKETTLMADLLALLQARYTEISKRDK